jgi:hypothetical protein
MRNARSSDTWFCQIVLQESVVKIALLEEDVDSEIKAGFVRACQHVKKTIKYASVAAAILFVVWLVWCFVGIRREKAQQQAIANWNWQHYTGWRTTCDFADGGCESVSYSHGIQRDRKTGTVCTVINYPGYPACPPQEYVVNGVPVPGEIDYSALARKAGAIGEKDPWAGAIPAPPPPEHEPEAYKPRVIVLHGGDTISLAHPKSPAWAVGEDILLIYLDGGKMLVTCGKYNDSNGSASFKLITSAKDDYGNIDCEKTKTPEAKMPVGSAPL